MNQNPLYKGTGLIILALLALLFVFWRKQKGEPLKVGFLIFTLLVFFILFYGGYIVAFRPPWWQLPY